MTLLPEQPVAVAPCLGRPLRRIRSCSPPGALSVDKGLSRVYVGFNRKSASNEGGSDAAWR